MVRLLLVLQSVVLAATLHRSLAWPWQTWQTWQRGLPKESKTRYLIDRDHLISVDRASKLGSELWLSAKERCVNSSLMSLKHAELEESRKTGVFPPHQNFMKAKPLIEKSGVYKLIKAMPKGAALHVHDSSAVDVHWMISNATYRDNCYMRIQPDTGILETKFFKTPPASNDAPWQLVSKLRSKYNGTTQEFDDALYENLTMVTSNPDEAYPTEAASWKRFLQCFASNSGLFFYKPVFVDYYYEALRRFRADNVQYFEIRASLLPQVYDLDGNTYDEEWMIQTYQNVTKQFKKDYPDFAGAKIIYAGNRAFGVSNIKKKVQKAMVLQQKYPDIFVGFDLVGWEEPGKTLLEFIDGLLLPSQQNPPFKLPYFFHAGETDWEGEPVDDNLFDALLLNTSRIGHGYALLKHPALLKMIKEKDVPVEVNPISNQVLGLVKDLRNHPVGYLIANNYSVVISSDDSAFWGSDPLSHDFYEIFMANAGAQGDLRVLKRLALDSIKFSAMTLTEKGLAIRLWENKWQIFINGVTKRFNCY